MLLRFYRNCFFVVAKTTLLAFEYHRFCKIWLKNWANTIQTKIAGWSRSLSRSCMSSYQGFYNAMELSCLSLMRLCKQGGVSNNCLCYTTFSDVHCLSLLLKNLNFALVTTLKHIRIYAMPTTTTTSAFQAARMYTRGKFPLRIIFPRVKKDRKVFFVILILASL